MSQICEVCGKKPVVGNQITTRGKAKYLGGVGTKVTGITKRRFKPNLQSIRVTVGRNTNKRLRVCTQCIRSGAVTKAVRSAPFRLPAGEGAKAAKKSNAAKTAPTTKSAPAAKPAPAAKTTPTAKK